jgi:hypothetical protein
LFTSQDFGAITPAFHYFTILRVYLPTLRDHHAYIEQVNLQFVHFTFLGLKINFIPLKECKYKAKNQFRNTSFKKLLFCNFT